MAQELLDAGSVEFDDGSVMNLAGFDLVLRHAEHVAASPRTVEVEVASLAVLVILKMIAYLDRPERNKDLADLALTLEAALESGDARAGRSGDVRLLAEATAERADQQHRRKAASRGAGRAA